MKTSDRFTSGCLISSAQGIDGSSRNGFLWRVLVMLCFGFASPVSERVQTGNGQVIQATLRCRTFKSRSWEAVPTSLLPLRPVVRSAARASFSGDARRRLLREVLVSGGRGRRCHNRTRDPAARKLAQAISRSLDSLTSRTKNG